MIQSSKSWNFLISLAFEKDDEMFDRVNIDISNVVNWKNWINWLNNWDNQISESIDTKIQAHNL